MLVPNLWWNVISWEIRKQRYENHIFKLNFKNNFSLHMCFISMDELFAKRQNSYFKRKITLFPKILTEKEGYYMLIHIVAVDMDV